jgi:hypothetical protein
MTARTLFRLAAALLVVGAVATLVGFAVHPEVDAASVTTRLWHVSHLLLWVGALALMVGLVGFYLRQRTEMGRLGAVGAGLAALGLAARSGAYYVETVVTPSLAREAPALVEGFPSVEPWLTYRAVSAGSLIVVSVGVVVLCVGAFRAGLAPRWATVIAALAALATPAAAAGPRAFAVVTAMLGVGLVGWAAWLWTNAAEGQPRREVTA